MIDLKMFCEKDPDFRPQAHEPVIFNGLTYATDGCIAVCAPLDLRYRTAPDSWKWPKQLREWLDEEIPRAKLAPLPPYQTPELETCTECGGQGCDDCEGGKYLWVPVRFGEVGVNYHYLKMLETLPALKIDLTGGSMDRIPFTFDGGEGLLMPMSLPDEP